MKTNTLLLTLLTSSLILVAPVSSQGDRGNGASTAWSYGVIEVDDSGFEIDCVAEPLRILASWSYKQHDVTTPGGAEGFKFQFTPITPNRGGFVLIGEITGKVYRSQNGMPANEVFHLRAGEVYSYRSHERYVADDGERLTIDWSIHMTTNANGELVLDRFELTCR